MHRDLNHTLTDALNRSRLALAVACVDSSAGMILGIAGREEGAEEALEEAAVAACELCSMPRLDVPFEETRSAEVQLTVSADKTHACVRLPRQQDLILVCLANGQVNVALLLAWAKDVAREVDGELH